LRVTLYLLLGLPVQVTDCHIKCSACGVLGSTKYTLT